MIIIGANGSTGVQAPVKLSASPKLRQKNYASPDCGAKILAANAEAEHTSAVLDPARDEYFLSICSAKIWFVVELCEAIQAQRVGFPYLLVHFALYSKLLSLRLRLRISSYFPRRLRTFEFISVIAIRHVNGLQLVSLLPSMKDLYRSSL